MQVGLKPAPDCIVPQAEPPAATRLVVGDECMYLERDPGSGWSLRYQPQASTAASSSASRVLSA